MFAYPSLNHVVSGTARHLLVVVASAMVALTPGCGGGSGASTPIQPANNLVPATSTGAPPSPQGSITAKPLSPRPGFIQQPLPHNTPGSSAAPAITLNGPTAPVSVTFVVPGDIKQSIAQRSQLSNPIAPDPHNGASRARQYLSASNVSIKIVVTPLGGSPATYTSPCSTGTCAISFTATAGPNTLALSLTDGAGGAGNVLSTYSTTVVVRTSGTNTFAFTANPVVNQVTLALASATLNAGTAADVLLSVTAKDFDGNTIIGKGNYVDANGAALSLTLNVQNSQAGGRGRASFRGPTFISSPVQVATYLHYDGGWLDHADVTVTPTRPIAGGVVGATFTTLPHATEYYGAVSSPVSIVAGPDGNLWFTESNINSIGKITPTGVVTHYSCPAPCNAPYAIINGSDGNLWFIEQLGKYVDKITTSGIVSRVTDIAALGVFGTKISGTALGPDGNVWWRSEDYTAFGFVTPSGIAKSYTAPGGRTLVFAPDANLWCITGANILKISTSGVVLATYPTMYPSAGTAYTGVVGPDGNLWFADNGVMLRITLNGTVTSYPLSAGANAKYITVGPDGYLWFTEQGGNRIGRMSTSGVLTEYSNGVSGNLLGGITLGPDGNIWYGGGAPLVGKFIL